MSTATWTLYFDRALLGNLTAVFPSTLSLTVDLTKDFTHDIPVKEGGNTVNRSFSCTWQGSTKGEDLLLTADNGSNHYYKGRIHKRTITRGTITHTTVVGILGHKPDAYTAGNGVGNEDNIVIFTGTP